MVAPLGDGTGSGELAAETPTAMQVLQGIAVSPGLALGTVVVLAPRGARTPRRHIETETVESELARLSDGLSAALREAETAESDARQRLGPVFADILAAHARIVSDPGLSASAARRVARDLLSAEDAVADVLDEYVARLETLSDPYLAARAADVRDVRRRILDRFATLNGPLPHEDDSLPARPPEPWEGHEGPILLFAPDLSPSETAGLDPGKVLGFATEGGGRTSHTAIVAAALEIPAVVGLGAFLETIRDGATAIIDGDEGLVVIDPDEPTLARYRTASAARAARFRGLVDQAVETPAQTADGTLVTLLGNIEFPIEAAACLERGAVGIGLYRTEFLYLNTAEPPDEEAQYDAYRAVIQAMSGRPVVIRTLDLGADKLVPEDDSATARQVVERNPFLGLRSIRLSLRDLPLFRTQLRAILRAARHGNVRVMFPMISTLPELRQARAVLREVADALKAEGVDVPATLPVGVMIEVPAAAVMADRLALEADFFSIGTNDLVQYTLAVDRTSESVADLFDAADPAVLRLIDGVVRAASAQGLEVSVCGAMGGEPFYTMLLLGLGIRQLSMPPHQLPEVIRVVRAVDMEQARTLARRALESETAAEINILLREAWDRTAPENEVAPPLAVTTTSTVVSASTATLTVPAVGEATS